MCGAVPRASLDSFSPRRPPVTSVRQRRRQREAAADRLLVAYDQHTAADWPRSFAASVTRAASLWEGGDELATSISGDAGCFALEGACWLLATDGFLTYQRALAPLDLLAVRRVIDDDVLGIDARRVLGVLCLEQLN
jgi:hypothetical protein